MCACVYKRLMEEKICQLYIKCFRIEINKTKQTIFSNIFLPIFQANLYLLVNMLRGAYSIKFYKSLILYIHCKLRLLVKSFKTVIKVCQKLKTFLFCRKTSSSDVLKLTWATKCEISVMIHNWIFNYN